MGRPSKYNQGALDEICERLSQGEPLAAICRDEGMPADRTVRDWIEQKPEVSAAIARARETGEEWLLAECLQIADTPVDGVIEKMEPDKATGELVVVERRKEDMLAHRKLQIETRLKLLAKWNPRKWGEKQQLEHSGPDGGAIAVARVDPSNLSDATLKELLNARRIESDGG